MAYEITQAIKITNPVADVDWYYNGGNADGWATLAAAKSGVPLAIRRKGRTVAVKDGDGVKEYWWRDGVTNNDLVEKGGSDIDVATETSNGLMSSSDKVKLDNLKLNLTLDEVMDGSTRKLANYLPLTGGVLYNSNSDSPLSIESNHAISSYIKFLNNAGTTLGYIGVNNSNKPVFYHNSNKQIALIEDIPAFPSIIDTAKSLNTDTTVISATSVDTLGAALKTYFDNNSSTIPRNKLVHYVCNIGSATYNIFGWWKDGTSGDGSFILPSGIGLSMIRPTTTNNYSAAITDKNYSTRSYTLKGWDFDYSIPHAPLVIENTTESGTENSSTIIFKVHYTPQYSSSSYYSIAGLGIKRDGTQNKTIPIFKISNTTDKQIALIEDINQTNVCAALGTGTDDGSFLAKDGTWKVPTGGGGGQGANISLSGNTAESGKAFSSANYNANTGVLTFSKTSFLTEHQDISGKANKSEMSVSTSGSAVTITLKTGTSASVSSSSHTHTASLATDTGTSAITLAASGKYKLTAGGSSVIFTMPGDTSVTQSGDTTSNWRKVLLGYQNDASVNTTASTTTNQAYVNPAIEVQPSTGTLRSKNMNLVGINFNASGANVVDYNTNNNAVDIQKKVKGFSTMIQSSDPFYGTAKTYIGTNIKIKHSFDNSLVTGTEARSSYYSNIYGVKADITGRHKDGHSTCIAIYGKVNEGYAGWFEGAVKVNGTIYSNNISVSGQITATALYQSSDDRLKNYTGDFHYGVEQLNAIPLRKFTYKDDESGKIQIGTSAQEIEKVLPEVVSENEEGYKVVDYSKLSIVALDCIKQLNAKIDMLEKRIVELEKQ